MTKNKLVGTLVFALMAVVNPVQAAALNTVTVGDTIGGFQITSLASGYSYDATAQGTGFDAFGFDVTGPGPGITAFGTAVADADLNTFVTANVANAGFTLSFTGLINRPGVDLVLFEIGDPEAITVKGALSPLTGVFTGDTISGSAADDGLLSGNNNLNLIAIDLSNLGFNPGDSVSSIVLGLPNGGADFALGAAVTAVPVPAAVWMFGSGLIGLVGIARRRRA